MFWILNQQWLSFRRSPAFEKDLGVKIFLGVIGLLFLTNLIFAASNIDVILNQFKGDLSPMAFLNSFILYYFTSELVMRYFLQTVPVLDIEPYLHLPIGKRKIANFLVTKSIFSAFNLLAPAFFIPIFFKIAIPEWGILSATLWLVFVLSFSFALHFFNVLFKKKLENSSIAWGIIIVLVAGHYISTNYFNFNLLPLGQLLDAIQMHPFIGITPLLLTVVLAGICYHFFTTHLYIEDLEDAKTMSGEKITSRLSEWGSKGLVNTLIVQELKLILRHKRSRSSLILSLIFLAYPLIFLSQGEETQKPFLMLIFGVLLTGTFIMNYGQFLWSWNTNQMDFFLTSINPYNLWIESRYRLLLYSALITSILALPYAYFGLEMLAFILAGSIYNIGINSLLIMRIGLWSPKPIELDKSAMMNYQGVGAAQFLIGLPVIFLPYIIFSIGNQFLNTWWSLAILAVVGLLGLLFRKSFFNAISNKLKKDKYKLINDLSI